MFGFTDDSSIPNLVLLTESIRNHEGIRLKPYTDTTGHITIGYGRDLTDDGISLNEAEQLLGNDIATAVKEAQGEPWWPHVASNDPRARAMVEIVFNMGLATLRKFVVATAALCRDDFGAAADAFMQSRWAQQVGQRAVDLTQMIRGWDDKAQD